MSKLYNDSVQVASEKIKWQRDDVASKIVDFEQATEIKAYVLVGQKFF